MMRRRGFLSMLGATSAAPLMPGGFAPAAASVPAVNRYVYGFAVFRARHGGAFSASELAASVKVSTAQAEAMIARMARDGVVRRALGGVSGAVEAVLPHGGAPNAFLRPVARSARGATKRVSRLAEDLADRLFDDGAAARPDENSDESPTKVRCNSDSHESLRSGSRNINQSAPTD